MSTLEAKNTNKAILLNLLLEISQQQINKIKFQSNSHSNTKDWLLNDNLIYSLFNKTQIINESNDAWKLFYKARDILPNGERLENLSWRLMFNNIRKSLISKNVNSMDYSKETTTLTPNQPSIKGFRTAIKEESPTTTMKYPTLSKSVSFFFFFFITFIIQITIYKLVFICFLKKKFGI